VGPGSGAAGSGAAGCGFATAGDFVPGDFVPGARPVKQAAGSRQLASSLNNFLFFQKLFIKFIFFENKKN
jgi:hypothetical protein